MAKPTWQPHQHPEAFPCACANPEPCFSHAASDVQDTSLLLPLCQCRATHVQPTLPTSLPTSSVHFLLNTIPVLTAVATLSAGS
jgi:hypothetical protein